MKRNVKNHNPMITWIVITVSVVVIFLVAHFVFGGKKPINHIPQETPKKTGISACVEQGENPVCDENGTQYTNACFAELANVSYGKCSEQKKNEESSHSGTAITEKKASTEECQLAYNPVCGADGNTYGNECLAKSAGVNVRSNGACQKEIIPQTENIAPEKPIEISPKNPSQETQTGTVTPSSNVILDLPSNTDEDAQVSTGNLSQYDEKKYHLYHNEAVGYSFAFPKNSAYRGFGPREGAQHTLAISATGTGVEDFATADVKVYYYKKIPTNPPSAQSITLQNGSHVYIVNENPNEKTNTIVKDIQESIQ